MRSQLMGGRSGRANSVLSQNVWTRLALQAMKQNHSGGVAREAQAGEWSPGSSTSSGEEDRKARSLEAENKEHRARIDALEKKEGVQGGPSITPR